MITYYFFGKEQKVYYEKYKNGLDIYFIPNSKRLDYHIELITKYGSEIEEFKCRNSNKYTKMPLGTAHFLEHKLFEQEEGENALDKLTKMGANPNAYTSFNHTAYLFDTTDNFTEVFKALMHFVQNPYLTEENVEKEKGIIGQEIGMYDDDPDWQLFFGFVNCLYGKHAITKDIAGTVETISHITPDILYKCYHNFYKPSNMVICVVGNVNVEEVVNLIKENVKPKGTMDKIERDYGEEKEEIYQSKIEKEMEVSLPSFMFGYKDNFNRQKLESGYEQDHKDVLQYDVALQIALELIAGKSTNLFEELYSEGLVTREFGLSFTYEEDYAYTSFDNESTNYQMVVQRVVDRIEELKKQGVNQEEFERTKKMLYGNFVKRFNDVSGVATMVISDYFKGINTFDYVKAYEQVDQKMVEEAIRKHFDESKMAVSVIKPKTSE